MPDLTELLERVEKSIEANRELDGDLAVAFHGGEIVWKQQNLTMDMYPARRHPDKNYVGGFANGHVPRYTDSLDAALALVAEKLPDADWEIWTAYLRGQMPYGAKVVNGHFQGVAKKTATPALAVIAALLRALLSQEREKADG